MGKVILTGYVLIPKGEYNILKPAIAEHIKLTLAEPGCLEFSLTQNKDDPLKYSLYEEFVDKTAFDLHQARTKASRWAKLSKNVERHFSVLEQ